MASYILSRSSLLLLLALLSLFSRNSISEAKSSFSFTSFGKKPSFDSDDISLYGDAKLVDGGSSISIQLNDSVSQGDGLVVYKKPIEFVETESEYPAGFSTFISFSISPSRGGRLGFVAFPVNGTSDHSLFEVKFDTSENFTKIGDSSVAVIVDGTNVPEKTRDFSIANLQKKEEEKLVLLYAWINYIAGGQFLEVRLSKSESIKPVDPVIFTWINLSGMLKGKDEFMVGVKSYNGTFNLHSWSLEARRVPKGMHSYGALLGAKLREEEEAKRRRRERVWEIVSCFGMTFASTGLVFFAMMHIWAAFKRKNIVMVMQEECGIKTKEFEYEKMEKMEIVMSKAEAQVVKK
ncbi:hypothetical protein EUTSA_v10010505mg [Eutrema salsugineum]|uniref:Legume lectin domain-containing protein n=1 Tax=Eutrema salsugineum TaxID=72664 RepID=V4LYU4_EUTSA|nr:L-type lectin-domain containing receptor kinase VIII.1 [Eutrema salsugineum]ESQ45073.1 hypothetical protein EUTSA_v10010505mg [Eutrema salsugineum]